jgi:hypothetical protein
MKKCGERGELRYIYNLSTLDEERGHLHGSGAGSTGT